MTTPHNPPHNAWSRPLDPSLLSNEPVSLHSSEHPVIIAPLYPETNSSQSDSKTTHDELQIEKHVSPQASSDAPKKKIIVLDSGAIITSATFAKNFLNDNVDFVTTAAVIHEIKSSKARATLNTLPFTLKMQNVWPDSIKEVKKYAERTGDYAFLSSVDMEVLALTYQLELRENGKSNIKDLPQKFDFGGKLMFKAKLTPYPGTEQKSHSTTTTEDNTTQSDLNTQDSTNDTATTANDGFNAGADASWGYFDDDNEEDGWITEENIHEHHDDTVGKESEWIVGATDVKEDNEQPSNTQNHFQQAENHSTSNVGCITTDYAMQNVLVQMGLNLISVEGRRILSLRRYVLRCTACRVIVPDTSRVFCPNCGNHSTLKRVECVIDENGEATFYYNPNYKFNLKGTNYQLPKPKGGQKAVDPIIREDQLLSVRRGITHKKKQIKPASSSFSRSEELFSREYSIEGVFDFKAKKESHWDTKDKLITGKPKPPPRKFKKKKRN